MSSLAANSELKKRILFTIFILLVYRFGTFVPIPGINSQKLVEEIKHTNSRHFVRSEESAVELIRSIQANQILLTLGAGDGWKFGMDLLRRLQEKE